MKKLMTLVLALMFAVGLAGMAIAGSLDSPGAPSGGSGMYTLSQVYDYLNSGIKATPVSGFQEPGAAPGPTMKSTREIYESIEAKFDQCPATTANVESGVKFFCHVSGRWGVQTGTGLMQPTPTITPTITQTPTITPTPAPTMTSTPWGYPDVVVIGGMYVASDKDGLGCAGGGSKNWTEAASWAEGLEWLGATDWRMPTGGAGGELSTICEYRSSLGSYYTNYYWSATELSTSLAWAVYTSEDQWMCVVFNNDKNGPYHVRAVRTR
ncbi:MAG: hypothetical protein NTZ78_09350 [Candidatus Aureabacteria bacterium]|nr:hypothetical protein [Candidatus Auribacterota bacterium]